jgi:hypothetical protein
LQNRSSVLKKGSATAEARLRLVSMASSEQDFSAKTGSFGTWKAANQASEDFFNSLGRFRDTARATSHEVPATVSSVRMACRRRS